MSDEPSIDREPPALDIGVIYTHEQQWMTPLVESLARSARGLPARFVLVDNASATGVDRWRDAFAQTVVLRHERRLGYAANLNRILSVAEAPYVLLLNTDMYFPPAEQCLAEMLRFMEAHPQCGVSCCRLYRADGTYGSPARRFPTFNAALARRLGWERRLAGSVQSYLYADRDRHESFACDWVSGCFLFGRRAALQQVGGLDEGYAKYFEDVDLCARLQAAGWSVLFHGGTSCLHYEQRASRRLLSRDAWLHARSYVRWLWRRSFPGPAWNPHFRPQEAATPDAAHGNLRVDAPQTPRPSGRNGAPAERASQLAR